MYSKIKKITALILAAAVFSLCSCNFSPGGPGTSDIISDDSASGNDGSALAPSDEIETVSETEPPETTTLPAVEPDCQALDSICRSYGAVGVEAAVIKNGCVAAVYEYGIAVKPDREVCSDTKYRIASLSKLVTDMVFMRLCDEGLVDENADIGDYLGYSVRNPYYPDVPITARMLMTHTSSVSDSQAFLSSRQNHSSESLESLLSRDSTYLRARPGDYYSYSNFGVAVIGAVCEKVTGEHFDTLAKTLVFGPLGIDASYTASGLKNPSLLGELYGFGGYSLSQQLSESFCDDIGQTHHLTQGNLTISAQDYAKIICVLLNSGEYGGVRILSPESAEAMLLDRNGLGYGLVYNSSVAGNEKYATHTGSNFGMFSAFAFSPGTKDGVVVLTSGADGSCDAATEIYNVCLAVIRNLLEA